MARTTSTRIIPADNGPDATTALVQAHADSAQVNTERYHDIQFVEAEFGDGQPFELGRLEERARLIRDNLNNYCMELGCIFLRIRAHVSHGEFLETLERTGYAPRFAQKCMQSMRRLGGSEPRRVLAERLHQSKLLELLAEDDDALDDLAEGGTLAGKTLDDIARMTTRELRETLRAERKEREDEKAADEEIIRAKDDRIHNLMRDKRKGNDSDKLRAAATDLLREADEAVVKAQAQLARLVSLAGDINQLYADDGLAVDGDVQERLAGNAAWARAKLAELADVAGE